METIKNLMKAFIGESMARNRYTFYAKVAKKEGFVQIADVFTLTADNEKEHAKWLFRMINSIKGNEKVILNDIEIPTTLGNTIENLKAAIDGEDFETTSMYPEFADMAEKEGFLDIAKRLRSIAKAEMHHRDRFKKLLKELENNTIFKKEKKVYWVCKECGYIHEGTEPPEVCPSCSHPKAYFSKRCEEY